MTAPPKNARPHVRHVAHHVEALAEKFAAMHAAAQTAADDHYAAITAADLNGTGPAPTVGSNGAPL